VVRHAVAPGWRFTLALTVLRELANAQTGPDRGVAPSVLCERLRLDPLQVEPIIERLQELDWVGALAEPGLARHVLLVDPARTRVAPLVQALLLSGRWQDAPFWQCAGLDTMTLAQALGQSEV
jgi:membrane protein